MCDVSKSCLDLTEPSVFLCVLWCRKETTDKMSASLPSQHPVVWTPLGAEQLDWDQVPVRGVAAKPPPAILTPDVFVWLPLLVDRCQGRRLVSIASIYANPSVTVATPPHDITKYSSPTSCVHQVKSDQ